VGDNNPNAVALSCSYSIDSSQLFPDIPEDNTAAITGSSESGAEGDILYDCKEAQFSLTPGINSLNIIDVQRQDDLDLSCRDNNKVKVKINYDYKTGVISYTGTFDGQTSSCSDTYISPLEAVITDDSSIGKLLLDWGLTDDGFISTTCTEDEEEAFNDHDAACSSTFSSNYTMMDSTGKTHRLSTKTTVSFR